MFPFTQVLTMVIDQIVVMLFQPLANPLFWIVFVIIAFQYKRMSRTKEALFGLKGEPFLRNTFQATIFGLLGGVFGSFLMILVGISITGIGLSYIWPIAILLMLVSPRFLCFAYAGGIVSLAYLFLGTPQVNVPQVLGLVAILHLVESLLILVSGHLAPMPIYAKNASGRLVGGFTLQKFWPIPIVLVFLPGTSSVEMPHWWPLIDFNLNNMASNVLPPLIGVVAGLGYGDIALTRTPKEKSKISALHLSIYSLVLLSLALLAAWFPIFAFLAAFFAPLGHEAIIKLGQNSEIAGKPIYVPAAQGVLVMDVQAKSPAAKAGIKSRDIILAINGQGVKERLELEEILEQASVRIEIEFAYGRSMRRLKRVVSLPKGKPLGIITAPEGYEDAFVEFNSKGFLARLWHRFR